MTEFTDAPYLRMTQRDDGKGIARHPRLNVAAGAGNQSSSLSARRAPRLGAANNYGEPPIPLPPAGQWSAWFDVGETLFATRSYVAYHQHGQVDDPYTGAPSYDATADAAAWAACLAATPTTEAPSLGHGGWQSGAEIVGGPAVRYYYDAWYTDVEFSWADWLDRADWETWLIPTTIDAYWTEHDLTYGVDYGPIPDTDPDDDILIQFEPGAVEVTPGSTWSCRLAPDAEIFTDGETSLSDDLTLYIDSAPVLNCTISATEPLATVDQGSWNPTTLNWTVTDVDFSSHIDPDTLTMTARWDTDNHREDVKPPFGGTGASAFGGRFHRVRATINSSTFGIVFPPRIDQAFAFPRARYWIPAGGSTP